MQNHRTVEEKAAEWNVSSQHIQYLCRNGKVEGALKRAGVWLIPDDAPVAIKNTKSGVKGFRFIGTKNRIFNSAIKLFMQKGFSEVSLRDIADDVGIRQSTIYNHFKSKQEVLDTIYGFYCDHYLKDQPSLAEMEDVLRNGTLTDIIRRMRYEFSEDYQQKMSDITKIIFQMVTIDERARNISKSFMIDEGIKYVEAVFDKGVESGRFAPFDTHAMAVFFNSVRMFALYNWIIDPSPDNTAKLEADEQMLYQYSVGLITDLKPGMKESGEKPPADPA